jgi:hypothetical protein
MAAPFDWNQHLTSTAGFEFKVEAGSMNYPVHLALLEPARAPAKLTPSPRQGGKKLLPNTYMCHRLAYESKDSRWPTRN